MTGPSVSGTWVEEKIAKRHQSARMRMLQEMHERHKTQRQRRRDIARVLLASSVLFLGVVMVEMGRKATHLLTTTTEHSRSVG